MKNIAEISARLEEISVEVEALSDVALTEGNDGEEIAPQRCSGEAAETPTPASNEAYPALFKNCRRCWACNSLMRNLQNAWPRP